MTESHGTGMGGALAAFVVGAAIGAGLALLYAPYAGEKTRRLLADKGRDLKNRVTDAVAATTDAMRERWEEPSKHA